MKFFYCCYCINHYKQLLQYCLNYIKNVSLLDKFTEINIHIYPQSEKEQVDNVIKQFNQYNNIKVITHDKNRYEFYALEDMLNNSDDFSCYMHSKSVAHNNINNIKWNYYMTKFLLVNCNYILNKLKKDIDVCGVEYRIFPYRHFSGNFFWTKKTHLDKLKCDNRYVFNENDRYDAQKMILSIPCKILSLNDTYRDLYLSPYVGNYSINSRVLELK